MSGGGSLGGGSLGGGGGGHYLAPDESLHASSLNGGGSGESVKDDTGADSPFMAWHAADGDGPPISELLNERHNHRRLSLAADDEDDLMARPELPAGDSDVGAGGLGQRSNTLASYGEVEDASELDTGRGHHFKRLGLEIDFSKDLLLRFVDRTVEHLFWHDYFKANHRPVQLALMLGTLVWIVFGVNDIFKFLQGERASIETTLAIRGVSTLAGGVAVALSYRENFERYMSHVVMVLLLMVGFSQTAFSVIENDGLDPTYSCFNVLVASISATYFRLPFLQAVCVDWLLPVVYVVTTGLADSYDGETSALIFTTVLMCLASTIFTLHAYYRELSARHGFRVSQTLQHEEQKSTEILLLMLPQHVVQTLKSAEDVVIQDQFEHTTVLFSNIHDFDAHVADITAAELVRLLNEIFLGFDNLIDFFNESRSRMFHCPIYKVETIGDVYMASAGVPRDPSMNPSMYKDHADVLCALAVRMQKWVKRSEDLQRRGIHVRIGLNSGPLIAGVIGQRYPRFRLIGDTVNVASRMSTSDCSAGSIQVSESLKQALTRPKEFVFHDRGDVVVKGKNTMRIHVLEEWLIQRRRSKRRRNKRAKSGLSSVHVEDVPDDEEEGVQPLPGVVHKTSDELTEPSMPGGSRSMSAMSAASAGPPVDTEEVERLLEEQFAHVPEPVPLYKQHVVETLRRHETSRNLLVRKSSDGSGGGDGGDADDPLQLPLVRRSSSDISGMLRRDSQPAQRPTLNRATSLVGPQPHPSLGVPHAVSELQEVEQAHQDPAPGRRALPGLKIPPVRPLVRSSTLGPGGSVLRTDAVSTQGPGGQPVSPSYSVFAGSAVAVDQIHPTAEPVMESYNIFNRSVQNMLNPMTLHFRDMMELEEDFQQSFHELYRRANQRAVAGLVLLLLILGSYDAAWFGMSDWQVIGPLRIASIGACVALLLYSRVPGRYTPERMQRLTAAALLVVAVLQVQIFIQVDEQGQVYGVGIILVMLALSSMAYALQFIYVVGLSTVVLLYYVVADAVANGSPALVAFFLIGGAFLYGYASYHAEFSIRRDYWRLRQLEAERTRSDALLDSMLPTEVIREIKIGTEFIASTFEDASVLFSDIAGFTRYSASVKPEDLVWTLNQIFSAFDSLTLRYGVYKVETIGDAYLACTGVVNVVPSHTVSLVLCGLEITDVVNRFTSKENARIHVRVGIHTGKVIAGVVGKKMPRYHLFGDTYTIAESYEEHGVEDQVIISDSTRAAIAHTSIRTELHGTFLHTNEQLNQWLVLRPHNIEAVLKESGLDQHLDSVVSSDTT